jgi:hypothetical protein
MFLCAASAEVVASHLTSAVWSPARGASDMPLQQTCSTPAPTALRRAGVISALPVAAVVVCM